MDLGMMLAAAVALAAPLMLVDEKSFFHIPQAEDFRMQRITRSDRESEWPFTVEDGYLSCAFVVSRPTVYFTENPGTDFDEDLRVVVVSTDPLDLIFAHIGGGGLVRKTASMADLIKVMAPFESLGARLCDQPRGTQIGAGEL
jgi:hypothetical protein